MGNKTYQVITESDGYTVGLDLSEKDYKELLYRKSKRDIYGILTINFQGIKTNINIDNLHLIN